ncbi:MAG: hypothetical protein J4N29_06195, partial [Chloroflexi bacterium]|nr:hypothetical protein [Chloroflexota bacterium]
MAPYGRTRPGRDRRPDARGLRRRRADADHGAPADRHATPDAHGDGGPGANRGADRDAGAHGDAHSGADRHADSHTDSHADADASPNGDADRDARAGRV